MFTFYLLVEIPYKNEYPLDNPIILLYNINRKSADSTAAPLSLTSYKNNRRLWKVLDGYFYAYFFLWFPNMDTNNKVSVITEHSIITKANMPSYVTYTIVTAPFHMGAAVLPFMALFL